MLVGTQVLKCGVGLESLGEFPFVGRQPGASHAVEPIHTICLHFLLCFLRTLTLFGHPIRCYIRSVAVVADAAVHENLLAWVFAKHGKELREKFVSRPEALPRKCDIPYPEPGYKLVLALTRTAQIGRCITQC